jgi:hypothetical protein
MQSLFNSWDVLLGDAIMTRVKHSTLQSVYPHVYQNIDGLIMNKIK